MSERGTTNLELARHYFTRQARYERRAIVAWLPALVPGQPGGLYRCVPYRRMGLVSASWSASLRSARSTGSGSVRTVGV